MGPGARRLGPFLVGLDDHDAGLFRNYAVPDDAVEPTPDEIDQLGAFFRDHGRVPRLEYLPELCPRLDPLLLEAEFVLERRLPVMTCPHSTSESSRTAGTPQHDGVAVHLAENRRELAAAAEAQNEAYGVAGVSSSDIARLESTVRRGGLVAVAIDLDTGQGVGAGLCAPPHGGVSELAAVGVRASHRRRGIAAAVTALLTREAARAGITDPFLTPAGDDEQRLYQRVGYSPTTTMIHISRPE